MALKFKSQIKGSPLGLLLALTVDHTIITRVSPTMRDKNKKVVPRIVKAKQKPRMKI